MQALFCSSSMQALFSMQAFFSKRKIFDVGTFIKEKNNQCRDFSAVVQCGHYSLCRHFPQKGKPSMQAPLSKRKIIDVGTFVQQFYVGTILKLCPFIQHVQPAPTLPQVRRILWIHVLGNIFLYRIDRIDLLVAWKLSSTHGELKLSSAVAPPLVAKNVCYFDRHGKRNLI